MRERMFLQGTDSELGTDIWIDADRIVAVRGLDESNTLVYLDGINLPLYVTEDGATIMDRLRRGADWMATP